MWIYEKKDALVLWSEINQTSNRTRQDPFREPGLPPSTDISNNYQNFDVAKLVLTSPIFVQLMKQESD